MGFVYVIAQSCPVKEALPLEELVSLIKMRNHARVVLEIARNKGDNRAPSVIMLSRQLRTPTGVQDRTSSVQELLDESARLNDLSGHCIGCPANVCQKDFGCYGYVAYPIQERTERWLMERLPASLESTAGKFMAKSVKDLQFDGRPISGLRPKDSFFESKTPVVRSWGPWYARTKISSDQVLQMLFCVESMLPSHAAMMALILGLIPHDTSPDDFGAIIKGSIPGNPALNKPLLPSVDEPVQISDMIAFLNAMCRASALGKELDTSY